MLRVAQVLKSNGTDGELLFTPRGNNRALVRLTGVRSLKDADELAGQSVYADYFEEEEEEDLVGWMVCNAEGQTVGTVVDYEDIPGNLCLWVERPDGEQVLLPFHEDLILSMEESTQTITMSIPEGILELEHN